MTPEEMKALRCWAETEELLNSDERTNALQQWEELSKYLNPNRSGQVYSTNAKGSKLTDNIYDNTGIKEADDLASTIHATLTSPAIKWSKWKYANQELNDDSEAIEWLEDSNARFHEAINSSNFILEAASAYKNYVVLASMCLFMEEVSENNRFAGFRFKSWDLSKTGWSENADSMVDKITKKFKMRARNIMQRYGEEKTPQIVKDKIKDGKGEEQFDVRWLIKPNLKPGDSPTGLLAPEDRPYLSYVILEKGKHIIEEDGFYEFPAAVARWVTDSEEEYGRGRGHIALPEVRTLNKCEEHIMEAAALSIRPPMKTTQRGILGSFNYIPAGLTVLRDINALAPITDGARFDVGQMERDDRRKKIRDAFFHDKFRLPPREEVGEMTAYEISERIAEMHKVLGPTIGRLDTEFLNPLSMRGFNMMLRGGGFRELPDILKKSQASVSIEYINPLARSQKIEEVQAIDRALGKVAQLAANTQRPELMDIYDLDAANRISAQIEGVPERILRSQKDVDKIRQGRQQQEQQQRDLEQANMAADAQAKMGAVDKEG